MGKGVGSSGGARVGRCVTVGKGVASRKGATVGSAGAGSGVAGDGKAVGVGNGVAGGNGVASGNWGGSAIGSASPLSVQATRKMRSSNDIDNRTGRITQEQQAQTVHEFGESPEKNPGNHSFNAISRLFVAGVDNEHTRFIKSRRELPNLPPNGLQPVPQ